MFNVLFTQVRNKKGSNVLKVRSDHGGEFENKPFEKIYEKYEILHEFSSPRTP